MRTAAMLAALATATAVGAQLPSGPGDWPGWRGPNRDNLSRETGLLSNWGDGGPTLLWKVKDVGAGYSTPSVANGVLYLLGAVEGSTESVLALDAATGKRLWATPFGKTSGGYPGPRSTPTIDGDALYVISSNGVLLAADAKTGAVRWKKDFAKDFGGQAGGWAYTESPLVDGELLICTPGAKNASVVALKKATGELVWKADASGIKSEGKRPYTTAAYSSVVVGTLAGVKQYVQFLSGGVVGIDAASGKVLWNYDRPANKTANISTPILGTDSVFAATAYNTGGGLVKLSASGGGVSAKEAYFLEQFQNHHGGIVLKDGKLYGTNGGSLLCVDMASGKLVWQNKSVGKGAVSYADGHLYVRSESGPVALVEANPTGYVEKGRFSQPDRSKQKAWPHPVIAGGRLFLRDQETLLCYDVKQK